MATKQIPHMKPVQLARELRKQGFTVTDEGIKLRIEAPSGGLCVLHKSSIDVPDSHTWPNIVKELRDIGFRDPWEVKRADQLRRKEEKGSRVFVCTPEIERFGVTCGCGREFKAEMHLARHLQAKAEAEGKKERTGRWAHHEEDLANKPETTKPTPNEEVRRIRALVKKMQVLATDLTELAATFEPLLQENEDLKRKLRKVEDLFGKVLDEL